MKDFSHCHQCGEEVSEKSIKFKHNDRCQWKKDDETPISYYRKLHAHNNDRYAEEILNTLAPVHKIDFCDISDMAVSNTYPLLFKKQQNMGQNIKYYNRNNIKAIKKYLKVRKNIILPKFIQIIQTNSFSSFIGPKFTKPSNRLLKRHRMVLKETESCFIITKKKNETIDKDTIKPRNNEDEIVVEEQVTQDLLTPSELVSVVNMEVDSVWDEEEGRFISPPANSNSSVQSNRPYSEFDSTKTIHPNIRKYRNLFLNPEKLSNSDFQALIHTTKPQFLKFTSQLRSNLKYCKEDDLNMYSKSFLFRLRLASCWTQDEISAVFGIPTTTGRDIFWNFLRLYYLNEVNIPNFLLEDSRQMIEKVLGDAYNSTDIYFR